MNNIVDDSNARLAELQHALDQHEEALSETQTSVSVPPNTPAHITVAVRFPAPGPCGGAVFLIHPEFQEGSALFFSVFAVDSYRDRIPVIPMTSYNSADEAVDFMLRLMALRYESIVVTSQTRALDRIHLC